MEAREQAAAKARAGVGSAPRSSVAASLLPAKWALASLLLASCGGGATTEPAVATLRVEPKEALIVGAGGSATFTAIALDADGALVRVSPEWSVGNGEVASVGSSGAAVGIAGGATTVTASVDGLRASARLEVHVPEEVAHYEPGRSYFGRRNYVEYVPGELPLILSASHGGAAAPREVPDRAWGTLRADRNTLELALAMRDALVELTGFAPHLVLSHLHRSKLDPNREIEEAAQGNIYAEQAWREFHDLTRTARATVWGAFGEGLYLDVHGHSHDVPRVELGYLLTADKLNEPDASLNSLAVVRCTSIRELGRDSPIPFSRLLRGATSFGGLLQEEGVRSVPSPSDPSPGDDPYWRGGYNTREHGSRADGELISGIQLEHHWSGLRDTEENRREYAARAARVVKRFMTEHFGYFEPGSGTRAGATRMSQDGRIHATSPAGRTAQAGATAAQTEACP